MDSENKVLKENIKELKKEIEFLRKALLVVAFILGVIIVKIIELSNG